MTTISGWQLGDGLLVWGINVLWQLTLLVAITLAVASLLKRRPAARYGVLSAGLLWALFAPLTALLAPAAGWSIFSTSLAGASADNVVNTPATAPGETGDPAALSNEHVGTMQGDHDSSQRELAVVAGTQQAHPPAATEQDLTNTPDGEQPDPSIRPSTAAGQGASLQRLLPPIILVWAVGAALLLSRMVLGWYRLTRLLRAARPAVDDSVAAALDEVCQLFGTQLRPRVLISRGVSGPFATGLGEPTIGLPAGLLEQVTPAEVREILIHEMAHLERRDQLAALLQALAGALFWIHPLIRVLNAQLAQAREEICDNYVLQLADRRSYCRTLLRVAELVQPLRLMPGTVALLTLRWRLETRVAEILDDRRSRATRLSGSAKVVVTLLSLVVGAIIGMGTVTLAADKAATSDAAGSAAVSNALAQSEPSINEPQGANPAAPAAPDERLQFAGNVVDAAGQPVAGAKIFLIRMDYTTLQSARLIPRATTDAGGHFEFNASVSELDPRENLNHWRSTPIVAVAEGHALDWALAANFETSGALVKKLRDDPDFKRKDTELSADRTLRLPNDDTPIEGRLISLEGNPVAGARIKVIEVQAFPYESIDAWLKRAQSKVEAKSPGHWWGTEVLALSEQVRQLFAEVTTNADGQFRVLGVGRDRIVRLQIEGPTVETHRIKVRTQAGAPVELVQTRPGRKGITKLYGASFEFPIAPSFPVSGVVRDADTQQPVPGVTIQIDNMAGDDDTVWPKESLRTISDAEGRYRIAGLPIGKNELLAMADSDVPYLYAAQECDTREARGPLELDFNLKRGVWVRGRVTDATTGAGVRADVEYYALLDNPYQRAVPSFWGAKWRPHLTDADGRFAVPAFPGQGVVAVRAHDYRAYPRSVGADKIAAGKNLGGGTIQIRTNPTILMADNHSALAEVNPAPGSDVADFNFILQPGKVLHGTVLGPDDQPLSGTRMAGEIEQAWIWRPLTDANFDVRNVTPGKPRRILVVHEENRLAGTLLVTGEESAPLSVKLEPWGTVRGRALDKIGGPLSEVLLNMQYRVGDHWQPTNLAKPAAPTDDDGRFTIEGLVAGVEYRFRAQTDRLDLGLLINNAKLSAGQTLDLGDVTVHSDK